MGIAIFLLNPYVWGRDWHAFAIPLERFRFSSSNVDICGQNISFPPSGNSGDSSNQDIMLCYLYAKKNDGFWSREPMWK